MTGDEELVARLRNLAATLVRNDDAAVAWRAADRIASQQWRGIADAPKDRAVLVTFAPDDIAQGYKTQPGMMVAYFDEYYAEGGAGYDGSSDGWVDAYSGEACYLHHGYPTHFMPLPEPPVGGGL